MEGPKGISLTKPQADGAHKQIHIIVSIAD